MFHRSIRASFTMLAATCLISGCMPMGPTEPPAPNYVPKFDFVPPSQAATGSAKVAFAVVDPQFPATAESGFGHSRPPVLAKFQKSMGEDFQEVLNAHGFTTRGPFVTFDEMTFPDKQDTDLIIDAEIDLSFDDLGTAQACSIFVFPASCSSSGSVQVGARMNLIVSESLTHEKMWTKRIELDGRQVSWRGTTRRPMLQSPNGFVEPPKPAFSANFSDPGFTNAVGPLLENYYGTIMDSAWKYLNPDEMASIKAKSKVIRTRKVY
ncbi:MAG TPA: hypothetical protein VN634_03790 [Candidatus Limnocylindrales bacterium]|jgi:hypothetical protein|nr:hypothetical protein [Candidatus Limnocylindrales bacterium]